jgi:hypothetical protein
MPPWLIGALIGTVVSVIMLTKMQSDARKIAPSLVPLLREKGPQTAGELAALLGIKGGNAAAKVQMALTTLVKTGEVVQLAVPPKTSARERLKIAKYIVKGGLANHPPPT